MTNNDIKCLCADIYKYFLSTLKAFHENPLDCPTVYLEICVSDNRTNTQYNIFENDISMTFKPTVPEYFKESPKTGYYGTFDSKNSDGLYFYKHGEHAIYISFKFQNNNVPEILKTLTRIFIENIIKPLSKVFNTYNSDYLFCTFWREFDEETVISKTVAAYLAYFYCLDNNFIHLLSTQKYENQILNGLIFASQRGTERAKNKITIRLTNMISLTENIRKTRKLMEITTPSLAMLIGKKNMILGYVDSESQTLYECRIEIIGHLNVNYCFNDTTVKYKQGVYRIGNSHTKTLPKFPKGPLNHPQININDIDNVMEQACEQKHGTLFIIGSKNNISDEVNRLCNLGRGMQTHHFSLKSNKNLIKSITSIDGAVFMDTNCVCHGIGIILDGQATVTGNPARGSRFNSAVTYIHDQLRQTPPRNFVAAIISEDSSLEYYYVDPI